MNHPGPQGVTWNDVAPLLHRWRIALIPWEDGRWDVLTGYDSGMTVPVYDARGVSWAQVPQTIWDLAERCEAA